MDMSIHKGGWRSIAWVSHAKTSVVIDDELHLSGKRMIADCATEEIAALVAAAPELLSVVETLVRYAQGGDLPHKAAMDSALAAIAKATGKAV